MVKYEFHSFAEIEHCEFKNPGIFQTNPDANAAAREFLEDKITHARAMLEKTKKAAPNSIMYNAGAECEAKIAFIEKWLNNNPAI